MEDRTIVQRRLHNQLLTRPTLETPAEVVHWMGAVQAQDYPAAKWAVAQRASGLTDENLDAALADGSILRTHLLRPTWHLVSPQDIRWLLALSAPRLRALGASAFRQRGLDETTFGRSNEVIAAALEGGRQLTRSELGAALQQAGIFTDSLRLGTIMYRAELDGIICSGALRGKQFTYALLDERVPPGPVLTREEALAELALRYFTSRGPATVPDFVWWSGLTVTDAKAGLEMVKSRLATETAGDKTYWFAESDAAGNASLRARLLPNYDEYIVGYADRSAMADMLPGQGVNGRENFLFSHTLVLDGQVVGTWKRTLRKGIIALASAFFTPPDEDRSRAFVAAADQYSRFLGKTVEWV